ncbi:MmcB family DNA repair protein [Komagataeibacter sp. AV436]|uniref:MmcB family DNA repair protein n=1 Tax=Komagataeibacter melomenusus TaxID=2766578 RepID=A0ABX2AFC2_9PROT|nr:MmcB family DNA repair protein [Komagataeibacter melomenusus]MBV1830465.1 MmcB family DNA repair protein [Komagataeibacter melomenusus]NPC66517.1 MmcB family DNA repair protein [Komagataeibacter melomenusus]
MHRPSAPQVQSAIRTGVSQMCRMHGWAVLHEFVLPDRRRADIMALTPQGDLLCIEIKSGLPDFRADHKWPDYLQWCDQLYFAVNQDFPRHVLPQAAGLVIAATRPAAMQAASCMDCAIIRHPQPTPLAAARRRKLTLQFAMQAAERLGRVDMPQVEHAVKTALRVE